MTARSGYTLLEVLVAFAIMSAVLAVILPGQSALLSQAGGGQAAFLATDYAQSRLDRLGLSDPVTPGMSEETYRDWRVRIETVPVDLPDGPEGYFRVSITVLDARNRVMARLETVKTGGG